MSRYVQHGKPHFLGVALLSIVVALAYVQVTAHSIDYLGMSITPSSTFNGASGNLTVTSPVAAGSTINFDLKYSIVVQGSSTTFPRTVSFGATTPVKPAGALDPAVSGIGGPYTFANASSNFTDSISITAPSTPGSYTVKIEPTDGTGGRAGLSPGGGITVTFTVATPTTPVAVATVLTVPEVCILLHQATADLTATLATAAGNTPIAGETVEFFIEGASQGTAVTDSNGLATLSNVNVSALGAGDHEVAVTYSGSSAYVGTNGIGNLGVSYLFLGFQQPINADGSSQFGGRTIPVKIKIADANGAPVTDADAHVFFAFGTPSVVGTEAEPLSMTNGDTGNLMRYDPSANQYIFNWDIAGLANGTYTIRVDLGEGSCGQAHTVVVSLKKKGSK